MTSLTKGSAARVVAALMAGGAVLAMAPAWAQNAGVADGASDVSSDVSLEEIVVTGSFVRTDQSRSASPLDVFDRADLELSGAVTVSDIVRNLPTNTGSEFNVDIFNQSDNAGTAQFNLRGLGVGSTLVLLNGRRQVNAGGANSDGVEFVDVNTLLPTIAINRVEILKDGASSIYGTEAVAGVVNFFTRDRFEGVEAQVQYQTIGDGQRDILVEGITGWANQDTNIVLSASYFDRTNILAEDFSGEQFFVDSGLGQPGSFGPRTADGVNAGAPAPDPNCEALGGTVGGPLCRFDLTPFTDVVPDDERLVLFATLRSDIDGLGELFLDVSYADRRTLRSGAPSFPGLNQPTVPSTNPGFVAGSAPDAILGFPNARFLGRPLGNGSPGLTQVFEEDMVRVAGGLRGSLDVLDGIGYEVAATYATGEFLKDTPDILLDRFVAALNGEGGPNNDQFFNPFGSGINADPSSPFYNDPAVIEDFQSSLLQRADNELFVLDVVFNGEFDGLFGLPIGWAVGYQHRSAERVLDFNQEGNDERFFFFVGGPDARGEIDVNAVFVEANIPLHETLELQTSARWEGYGGRIGDTLDPRVAVLWTPFDWLSARGSFSTSFRAPQLNQLFGADTSLFSITDTSGPGGSFFVPTLLSGSDDLTPEQTDTFNAGITVEPLVGLTLSVDYFRFETTDLIVAENAQQIVDQNDPAKVLRGAGGNIERLLLGFVNAASLTTDGIDFSAQWDIELDTLGALTLTGGASFINSYEFRATPDAPAVDLDGFRNRETPLAPTPKWRANLSGMWSLGAHQVVLTGRYISGFVNDSVADNPRVDSFTTLDVQYTANVSELLGYSAGRTTIAIGANNITDVQPPFAETPLAFAIETRVHDPRGRIFYVRAQQSF